MESRRLDLDALAVDSFETSPAEPAPEEDGAALKATRITSCNPPPYCTC